MPIYIIHYLIGKFILCAEKVSGIIWQNVTKLGLYFGVSILVSIIAMYLVDHWKWFQSIIKKPFILKD